MKKSDINVLIVDDDQTVGRTLSEVINRAGYKATFASRADEALNVVRLKHIHAAVIEELSARHPGALFKDVSEALPPKLAIAFAEVMAAAACSCKRPAAFSISERLACACST